MAAAITGFSQRILDEISQWITDRYAFGAPIGRFTHIQQELAKYSYRVHSSWLSVCNAFHRISENLPTYTEGAMLKAESAELATQISVWALSVLGARGYLKENNIHKWLSSALGLRIADGSTDVLRTQVARNLLGERIYHLSLYRDNTDLPRSNYPSRSLW